MANTGGGRLMVRVLYRTRARAQYFSPVVFGGTSLISLSSNSHIPLIPSFVSFHKTLLLCWLAPHVCVVLSLWCQHICCAVISWSPSALSFPLCATGFLYCIYHVRCASLLCDA
jgi:hypothetical protein